MLDEHRRAFVELLLAALRFLGLGHDVDVPAGELRGEAHVLAAPADGLRELLVRHHHLDALGVLVHHHLGDFRRLQRVDDEGGGVVVPRDDVDLLALELVDYRLDARPAHADAGADRVDRAVVADHADLGARAGVAGHRLDLDDVVIDLRHLHAEQLGHEFGRGAAHEDLRAAGLGAHVADIAADPVADPVGLARDQLVAADDRLGTTQIDDDVAVFDPLGDAVDDFADPVLELLVLALALGLADLLDDHLLGGLGGDAAKIHRRQGLGDEIADLGRRVLQPGLGERDLGEVVLDLLDHLQRPAHGNLAGLAVDEGADVVFGAVARARGLAKAFLHRLDHQIALDQLLAGDRVGDLQQLQSVRTDHIKRPSAMRGL